jgi:hypothetical protein
MRLTDINFALTAVLHALVPPAKQQMMSSSLGSTKQRHLSVSDSGACRTSSIISRHGRNKAVAPHETLQTVAFLGKMFNALCKMTCCIGCQPLAAMGIGELFVGVHWLLPTALQRYRCHYRVSLPQ